MEYEIVWRSEARDDLSAIYDWITEQADPVTAFAYTSRIEAFASRLSYFPNRGTPRFILAKFVRTVTFERRIIVAYRVESRTVRIFRLIQSSSDIGRAVTGMSG